MARNLTSRVPRAPRARASTAAAALALAVLVMTAVTLQAAHRDARSDLERRVADRAESTAAMVDALLDARAAAAADDLIRPRRGAGGTVGASVRNTDAIYALVAGADGRVLAASPATTADAAARAAAAADRLGFPGAPRYLLRPSGDAAGRPLLEIAVSFRAGGGKRVHVAALPARAWAAFFDAALARSVRGEGSRALVLDEHGRVLGDSAGARHPGAPHGRDVVRRASGEGAVAAAARIGRSPLRVVYLRSTAQGLRAGRQVWASWLALALAALAIATGLWLMARLRASHAALLRSEERYALAMRAANDGLWDWDLVAGRVHYSDRWAAILGLPSSPGDDPGAWLDRVHPEDRPELDAAVAAHVSRRTDVLDHEHRLRAAGGEWIWARVRGLAVFAPDGAPVRLAGSLSDVTARRRALDHLEHQATHDPLTGLANRAHFFSVLDRVLERGRRGEQPSCAVVFIDLDGFKLVNDRYGHVVGDAVLATAGLRLKRSVRPGDVVARLGGDELAVLVPECESLEEARALSGRLCAALAEPYEVLGEELVVGASAGVAIAEPEADAEDLLHEADAAMYRAKLAV